MKFSTDVTKRNFPSANGTSLQGYIEVKYSKLAEIFGHPNNSEYDDYKSDAEWVIAFNDGTVATIYNYKDGKNYRGDQGLDVEDITHWHVGGHDKKALSHVQKALGM